MIDVQKIKQAFLEEGLTKSQICKKYHYCWGTVSKVLETSLEEWEVLLDIQKTRGRGCSVLTDDVRHEVNRMLTQEKEWRVHKKQRLTGRVIFNQLKEQSLYKGSYRALLMLIAEEKRNLKLSIKDAFLPLEFPLGSTLQIDHGEVECSIEGSLMKCFLFVASVPGTSIRYCQLFPCKGSESWGEFHERVFQIFGGIFSKIVYDNDTVLVKLEETRNSTHFALHLVEHYKFSIHHCNPRSGNEKGSVENNVKYCRRNYFHGCPCYPSFVEPNAMLDEKFRSEVSSRTDYRTKEPLGLVLEAIRAKLLPLPPYKAWCRRDKRIVNSYQQVEVEGHRYSVPLQYVGRQVVVRIYSFGILIVCDKEEVLHRRQFVSGTDSLYWEHYLEQLKHKPGALWDCKATQNLLEDPLITKAWNIISHEFSSREAQKEFIDILFLRKENSEDDWRDAIEKAIKLKRIRYEEVKTLLRLKNEIREDGEIVGEETSNDFGFSTDQYNSLFKGGALC